MQPTPASATGSDQGAGDGQGTANASAGDPAGGGQPAGEPGFEASAGSAALPDMRDNPTLDPGTLAALEAAMEAAAKGGNAGTGEGAGTANDAGAASGAGPGDTPGRLPGNGGAGTGPLTPAEQVAILDARLEAGAGDFDTMILEEQARQRSARRASSDDVPASDSAGGAPAGGREGPYGEDITVAGAGGGRGSVNTPGRSPPPNTARYPAPDDIPSGNDDDVVARQLREAAMREPDPAVREKLWDEYRKYKGLTP